jgi:hypothetical protein
MNIINLDIDRSIMDLCKKKHQLMMQVKEINKSIEFLEKQKQKSYN